MKRSNLTIAVLSGKGGTGKTLVSVNLAAVAEAAVYVDCDVEEPNGHLFFQPEITREETVSAKIPSFDYDRCKLKHPTAESCLIPGKAVLFKAMRRSSASILQESIYW